MSRLQISVDLTPPAIPNQENESLLVATMTCSYCHGDGYIQGISGRTLCPVCWGNRLMDAEVRITWRPRINK